MKERPTREIRTAEPAGYAEFLAELKQRIESVQLQASLARRGLWKGERASEGRGFMPASSGRSTVDRWVLGRSL
jgi:hypothetical protein